MTTTDEIGAAATALRDRLARLAQAWTVGTAPEPWIAELRAIRIDVDRLLIEAYRARGTGEVDAAMLDRLLPALEQVRDGLRTVRPRFDPERLRARVHAAALRLAAED